MKVLVYFITRREHVKIQYNKINTYINRLSLTYVKIKSKHLTLKNPKAQPIWK